MKRVSCIIVVIVLLGLCACTAVDSDMGETIGVRGKRTSIFYATTEQSGPETKVYADEKLRVLWNAGDLLTIFNKSTYNSQFQFVGEDGDNAGDFEDVTQSSGFVSGNPLSYSYAVYPYDKGNKINNDGNTITLTLPAKQQYREHSFGIGANTMAAVTDNIFLAFKNLGGYLQLRLYGNNVKVGTISIQGNNGEKIAGKANVAVGLGITPTVTMDATATETITLVCDPPVQLGTTAEQYTDFWFVIPPVTFVGGFTVTITDELGGVFQQSTTKSLTISRSTIEWMSTLEVTPVYGSIIPNKYLTFTSEGTTTLSFHASDCKPLLYYSTDAKSWTQWDYSELSITRGSSIYICGDNPAGFNNHFYSSPTFYSRFIATGDLFSVSGDIMSLINLESDVFSIPSDYCFSNLFYNCTNLTIAPNLPATSLRNSCYDGMYYGCISLKVAPELPSTTLASYCYHCMFRDCTSLVTAPKLPATSLAYGCYDSMFSGCTSLRTAPELPAEVMTEYCYNQMFWGCVNLSAAPDLPATSLAKYCYQSMFCRCSNLESAPNILPATTLEDGCYFQMFFGCSSLTKMPVLKATELANSCYRSMFAGCTNITTASDLPAAILAPACYLDMFNGCAQLSYIKCMAIDVSATNCIFRWLDGVAASGTFVKAASADWPTGGNGIPEGWTVLNEDGSPVNPEVTANKYLTFRSEGVTILSLNVTDDKPLLYFSYDATEWTMWDYSGLTITSESPIYICGDNPAGFNKQSYINPTSYSRFIANGDDFRVSGDMMSLINKDNNIYTIPSDHCFAYLFSGCTNLIVAPSLPATSLSQSCYSHMFNGCRGLIAAPELPATTLSKYCYSGMFYGCSSLSMAPELPATTLADYCYSAMFDGCYNLLTPPVLPATTLASFCYIGMFKGCMKLTYAPVLPATSLARSCYADMFHLCSGLTSAPELPATTLAAFCYSGMFSGCTSLISAPELPATTLTNYCYSSMFNGCVSLTTAPILPSATLTQSCYESMFKGCKKLSYVKCLASTIGAENCISKWVEGVAATGTFVKAASMALPPGDSGIPEGWTVVNAE